MENRQFIVHKSSGGYFHVVTSMGKTPDFPWNCSPEELNQAIKALWEPKPIPWWNLWARFKRWYYGTPTRFRLNIWKQP